MASLIDEYTFADAISEGNRYKFTCPNCNSYDYIDKGESFHLECEECGAKLRLTFQETIRPGTLISIDSNGKVVPVQGGGKVMGIVNQVYEDGTVSILIR